MLKYPENNANIFAQISDSDFRIILHEWITLIYLSKDILKDFWENKIKSYII